MRQEYMKKIFTLLFIYLFSIGHAQMGIGSDNTFQAKNIFPGPSPAEAYSFSKVGKLPMDLFRGKANISIPFYSIKIDGLEIPISLSYNTGGIKLNEVAGSVGLGWSLNIPGTINKSIIGRDDSRIAFFSKDASVYGSYNGTVSHLDFDEPRRINLQHIYDGDYDTKPDLYSYSLPGVSGSFIMNANNLGMPIPYENVKIEQIRGQYPDPGKFKATDTSGNIFWFSPKSMSASYDPTNPQGDNIGSTLFRIDSIRTASNKTVKFFYEKNLGYIEKNIVERIYTKTGIDYDPGKNYFNLLPPAYERWNTETSSTENLISRIEFPEGTAEFKYSNDENGTLALENGALYRKDLNTNSGIALRKIIVKDRSNHIVSDQRLNYEYFSSNNSNKTYEDYRLKLTNVYDALSQTYHKFTYNEDYPMPTRNSHNDDYWGYINNLSNTYLVSNLPLKIYTDIPDTGRDLPSVTRRDRAPNPSYSQIGILKSIEYPTKGKKNLYYENPVTEQINTNTYTVSEGMNQEVTSFGYSDGSFNGGGNKTFILNESDIPGYGMNPQFTYGFDSGCLTADTPGDGNVHPNPDDGNVTECFGDIKITSVNSPNLTRHFGSNGRPFTGSVPVANIGVPFPIKVELVLSRMGVCNCAVNAGLTWRKDITETTSTPSYLSGLRIKKIEDVDQNNVSNVFEYKYGKFNTTKNKFENISVLKQPFNFTRIDKKIYRRFDDQGLEYFPSRIQEFFTLSNSDQASNSYGSSDIVTYPYVIEENGLGKVFYEFSDKDYQLQSILPSGTARYNDWKYGLPLNEKYVNKDGETVKTVDYEYNFNTLKNGLSDFVTNTISKIAFGTDMLIIPSKIQVSPGQGIEGDVFYVESTIDYIESAKIENVKTTEKDFLLGKAIEKTTVNTYTDTDINKPINLKNTTGTFASGEKIQTSYNYAHEKGNQLMISKNMISIPLEKSIVQVRGGITKTLSGTETIYPKSAAEITNNTNNLVLPLSVISYDIQNNTPSTEATYDSYDSKGNLLQYTTRDRKSTVIIWGYNQTQPIAKIENAKLADIPQSLITTLMNASDTDAAASPNNDETALLNAFRNFRNSLPDYQITTYSYDPLIGVRSISAPSGITEFYTYDSAHRLEKVMDSNGKVLKEMKYNYKN